MGGSGEFKLCQQCLHLVASYVVDNFGGDGREGDTAEQMVGAVDIVGENLSEQHFLVSQAVGAGTPAMLWSLQVHSQCGAERCEQVAGELLKEGVGSSLVLAVIRNVAIESRADEAQDLREKLFDVQHDVLGAGDVGCVHGRSWWWLGLFSIDTTVVES